jgi:hypothetical protein
VIFSAVCVQIGDVKKKKEKRREYIFTDYYLTSPSAATGQLMKLKKRNSIS